MTTTEVSRPNRRKVRLNAFDPSCAVSEVGKTVVGNRIVPARDVNALGYHIANGVDIQSSEVQALAHRVNDAVYGASQTMYELASTGESPQDFFERHMKIAQDTQNLLAERVNPNDPYLNMPQGDFETPADIVMHLADPAVETSSKDMLTTRLALALVSAEQESYFRGTEQVREEVDGLFSDIITERKKPVYTVHDNQGNGLQRLATDLDTLFAEPINPGEHVKEHVFEELFQHQGEMDEVGKVAVISRIKSEKAAALKTVRLAILRHEKEEPSKEDTEKGDSLDVTDVTDLIGSTVIVMGAKSSKDPSVTKAREKVIEQFQQRYPGVTIKDKSQTQKRPDSKDFDFQRIIVDGIPGLQGGYEVFLFGQDYFDYKYKVGEIDPTTDEPTGPAHPVYRDLRYLKTYMLINPHIGEEEGRKIKQKLVAKDVEDLLTENRTDEDVLYAAYQQEIAETFGSQNREVVVFSQSTI